MVDCLHNIMCIVIVACETHAVKVVIDKASSGNDLLHVYS